MNAPRSALWTGNALGERHHPLTFRTDPPSYLLCGAVVERVDAWLRLHYGV